MDRDTIINSIKEIGTCEDQIERLNKLTNLEEEISKVFDDKSGLETKIKSLEESIVEKDEKLNKANEYAMDMFLKTGKAKEEGEILSEKTGIKEEPKKEYKSYKELAKNYM